MTEYVSVRTPHGVTGFEPGRKVHVISTNDKTGVWLVSDGQYQVEVMRRQLTNDIDIASAAQQREESTRQAQLAASKARKVADENARRFRQNLEVAHDVAIMDAASGLHSPAPPPPQPLRLDPRWKLETASDASYNMHGNPYGRDHHVFQPGEKVTNSLGDGPFPVGH